MRNETELLKWNINHVWELHWIYHRCRSCRYYWKFQKQIVTNISVIIVRVFTSHVVYSKSDPWTAWRYQNGKQKL